MATVQITGLNPIGVVNDSDLILVRQGVEDFKATVTDLKNNLDGDYLQKTDNLASVQSKPASFDNIKQPATETYSGVVEFNTDAEAIAGTDRTRSMNAANVKAVLTGTDIIAGNGLVDGGNLGSDVTLNMGTPSTITGTSTNSVSADSHTHDVDFSDADLNIHGLTVGTSSTSNNICGTDALSHNITGDFNTAIGYHSLQVNTTGHDNTSVGCSSLTLNTTGSYNTAVGLKALYSNNGNFNTAVGNKALFSNTSGGNNTSLGSSALYGNTTGYHNVAIGYNSLYNSSTGYNNITIGYDSGNLLSPLNITTESNRVVIGNNDITNAYIKVAWTVTSDQRDKTEIKDIPVGLSFVEKLHPVSYQFKEGDRESTVGDGITRYGFLAQEVLEVEGDNPVIVDTEMEDLLKLKESNLIPVLVQAIKELSAELKTLKAEISSGN